MQSIIKHLAKAGIMLMLLFSTQAVHAADTTGTGNAAPEFASPPGTDAETGVPYFGYTYAIDDHDWELTYSLQTGPAGFALTDSAGACMLEWTPGADQAGDHDVIIRATDSEGLYADLSYTITVTGDEPVDTTVAVNEAPVFTSVPAPTVDAQVGKLYYSNSYATDDNDRVVTYTLQSGPAGLTLIDTAGYCYLLWTPAAGQGGDHDVIIRATDSEGLYADLLFTITVTGDTPADTTVAVNEAPVFASVPAPTVDAQVGNMYYSNSYAMDDNDRVVTYTLQSGPAGLTLIDTAGYCYLLWTPAAGQGGDHAVVIRATDSEGLYADLSYTITVTGDAPADTVFSAPVDTSGGVVTDTFTGTTVDIPADAVIEAIVVEIEPVTDVNDSAVKTAIEFNVVGNPNGYTFENPVAITIKYAPGKVNDPANLRIAYFNESTGEWEIIEASTVDTGAQTVTAYVTHFSTYGVVETDGSGTLLPVELDAFTAAAGTDGINLEWRTVSEQNSLGFNVLHSNAADGIFSRINSALIRGAGNATDINEYAFTDIDAADGINYYQLAMISLDGSIEYSDVINATMAVSGISNIPVMSTNELRSGTLLRMDGSRIAPGTTLQPGIYLVRDGNGLTKTLITE